MNALNKYFNRSFVVSALLPTTVFILTLALMLPFAPLRLLTTSLSEIKELLIADLVLPVMLTLLVSFLVYDNQQKILLFFSGYYLPELVSKLLVTRQKKTLKRNIESFANLKFLQEDKDWGSNDFDYEKYAHTYMKAENELASIESMSPIREEWLVPTKLGNIFIVLNEYTLDRYGIAILAVFPRLYMVIPKEFKERIEDGNDQLNLVISSAYFSLLLGFISIIGLTSKYLIYLSEYSGGRYLPLLVGAKVLFPYTQGFYLVTGTALFAVTYLIYRVSLTVAVDYVRLLKTAFDFYRFELLQKLNLTIPKTRQEEISLWKKISHFYISGDNLGKVPIDFEYAIDTKLNTTPRENNSISKNKTHSKTGARKTKRKPK